LDHDGPASRIAGSHDNTGGITASKTEESMRKLLQILVLTGAAVGLAVASPALAQKEMTPKTGGILTFGVKAEPPTYDLQGSTSYGTLHFTEQHYSLLLNFDLDNWPALKGDVAESWEESPDHLTYTFKIRQGIEFHDGTPLTSKDVKASYDRLRNPPEGIISPRQPLFTSIDTIETPDDYTVVFNMKEPDTFYPALFAIPYNAIYAAKDIEKEGNWHAKNINGTGPFKFVEHVPGEKWVANRFEDYHFDDVYLDGTIGYRIKDITPAMVGGQIMVEMRSVSPPEIKNLKEQMGDKVKFETNPWLTEWRVSLNTDFEAFKDERVRQALTMCIDRYNGLDALSKITFTGGVTGFNLTGSEWALPDDELKQLPGFRPDIEAERAKAREMLKEAGYEGLSFRYSNRGVAHPYDHMAIFLISQWKACGLNPVMETNPSAKFVEIRKNKGFDATIDWNASQIPEPTQMLRTYISADINPENYSGAINREVDELYEAQRREFDMEKRKEMVHKIDKIVIDEAWNIPIAYANRVVAMNSKVMGFRLAFSHTMFNDFRGVWLDE
jgi:peptide/nickel transport system substrate-binding protein